MRAQTNLSIQETEQTLFEQIYQAASNHDSNQLQALLKEACVDVLDNSGMQTPAGRLATEGNIQAVELLKKYGANLTNIASGFAQGGYRFAAEELRKNYGINVSEVARGAALGGCRNYAEYLRQYHGACVNYIIRGAAIRRDQNYIKSLCKKYELDINEIASGAVLGGNCDYAEYLRIKYGVDATKIASGAARGGYFNYAEELRKHHEANVNKIARGAALGGHLVYAELLRVTYHAKVNYVVWGAAFAGRRAYAEYLRLSHSADVHIIAEAAAQGRHQSYAEYLYRECNASINSIAHGATVGAHHSYMEDLYQNEHADLQRIVDGAIDNSSYFYEASALHSLTFLRGDKFREILAKKLQASKHIPHPITDLVPKAQAIKKNMLNHQMNYDQGLAWTQSDISGIFLQFSLILKITHLPAELLIMVSEYLAVLTQKDAFGLLSQLEFEKERQMVIEEMEKFAAKKTYFFGLFGRSSEIHSLSKACRESTSRQVLAKILQKELEQTAGKKDNTYYELMTNLYERLTQGQVNQIQPRL